MTVLTNVVFSGGHSPAPVFLHASDEVAVESRSPLQTGVSWDDIARAQREPEFWVENPFRHIASGHITPYAEVWLGHDNTGAEDALWRDGAGMHNASALSVSVDYAMALDAVVRAARISHVVREAFAGGAFPGQDSSGFPVAYYTRYLHPGFLADGGKFVREVEKYYAEAMEDFAELDDYADEVGVSRPSPAAKQTAQRIVGKICAAVPRYYSLGPWKDGGVVIEYNNAKKSGVIIYCDKDGGASFFVMHPGGCAYQKRSEDYDETVVGEVIDRLRVMPV